MTKAKAKPKTDKKKASTVVIFGLDEDNKPKAGKFSEAQKDLALKASILMKLNICEVDAGDATEVLAKLPEGKLYSSGTGFVPNIRVTLYWQLLQAFGLSIDHIFHAGQRVDIVGYPTTWQQIRVGHIVIAQCDAKDEGWWEAVVVETDGDMLTTRWRYEPSEPHLLRHRSSLALLNASAFSPASE